MNNALAMGFVRTITWRTGLQIGAVLGAAWLLAAVLRGLVRVVAERAPPRFRLPILRFRPIVRLLVVMGAVLVLVPMLIEPSLSNVVELAAAVGVALAFALKDYVSSLAAGLATVLENAYQPGDWIAVGGVYGEVRSITLRAVRIVTADDTEVVIPHSRLWTEKISNATSGNRSMLCVAEFYLDADHDGAAASRALVEVAETGAHRLPGTPVTLTVAEKPWGTQYRLKAYVRESRDQFAFTTDLTIRGKAALRSLGFRFARVPLAETHAT